ncbi:hypothetical protein TNIN_291591 [Trichonephila inaurata madagascariensis]|uniref:Uncharacterized protein n=1 Tax=Trichonephila inaurata madagascariensis TaxID=2747483 RepID=A0A8X6WWM4_9ARAC|nr:hypothetical protein TNIN_291591 [Trichonephila inaurata madagascariensis]
MGFSERPHRALAPFGSSRSASSAFQKMAHTSLDPHFGLRSGGEPISSPFCKFEKRSSDTGVPKGSNHSLYGANWPSMKGQLS